MHSDRRAFLRVGSVSGVRQHPSSPGPFWCRHDPLVFLVQRHGSASARFRGELRLGRARHRRFRPGPNATRQQLRHACWSWNRTRFCQTRRRSPQRAVHECFCERQQDILSPQVGGATSSRTFRREEFAARLAGLSGKEIAFGHDALTYDPATKTFADPFGALNAAELKLINHPTKTAAALEVALRGMADGRARREWRKGKISRNGSRSWSSLSTYSSAAQPIAAAFVKWLPSLVALAGTEVVKSAVTTPLVSSASKAALGIDGRAAIGEFDRVRAIFGQSYSDGAVWLYVLLGKQMKTDIPDGSSRIFPRTPIGARPSPPWA